MRGSKLRLSDNLDYQVEGLLGEGGCSQVWELLQTKITKYQQRLRQVTGFPQLSGVKAAKEIPIIPNSELREISLGKQSFWSYSQILSISFADQSIPIDLKILSQNPRQLWPVIEKALKDYLLIQDPSNLKGKVRLMEIIGIYAYLIPLISELRLALNQCIYTGPSEDTDLYRKYIEYQSFFALGTAQNITSRQQKILGRIYEKVYLPYCQSKEELKSSLWREKRPLNKEQRGRYHIKLQGQFLGKLILFRQYFGNILHANKEIDTATIQRCFDDFQGEDLNKFAKYMASFFTAEYYLQKILEDYRQTPFIQKQIAEKGEISRDVLLNLNEVSLGEITVDRQIMTMADRQKDFSLRIGRVLGDLCEFRENYYLIRSGIAALDRLEEDMLNLVHKKGAEKALINRNWAQQWLDLRPVESTLEVSVAPTNLQAAVLLLTQSFLEDIQFGDTDNKEGNKGLDNFCFNRRYLDVIADFCVLVFRNDSNLMFDIKEIGKAGSEIELNLIVLRIQEKLFPQLFKNNNLSFINPTVKRTELTDLLQKRGWSDEDIELHWLDLGLPFTEKISLHDLAVISPSKFLCPQIVKLESGGMREKNLSRVDLAHFLDKLAFFANNFVFTPGYDDINNLQLSGLNIDDTVGGFSLSHNVSMTANIKQFLTFLVGFGVDPKQKINRLITIAQNNITPVYLENLNATNEENLVKLKRLQAKIAFLGYLSEKKINLRVLQKAGFSVIEIGRYLELLGIENELYDDYLAQRKSLIEKLQGETKEVEVENLTQKLFELDKYIDLGISDVNYYYFSSAIFLNFLTEFWRDELGIRADIKDYLYLSGKTSAEIDQMIILPIINSLILDSGELLINQTIKNHDLQQKLLMISADLRLVKLKYLPTINLGGIDIACFQTLLNEIANPLIEKIVLLSEDMEQLRAYLYEQVYSSKYPDLAVTTLQNLEIFLENQGKRGGDFMLPSRLIPELEVLQTDKIINQGQIILSQCLKELRDENILSWIIPFIKNSDHLEICLQLANGMPHAIQRKCYKYFIEIEKKVNRCRSGGDFVELKQEYFCSEKFEEEDQDGVMTVSKYLSYMNFNLPDDLSIALNDSQHYDLKEYFMGAIITQMLLERQWQWMEIQQVSDLDQLISALYLMNQDQRGVIEQKIKALDDHDYLEKMKNTLITKISEAEKVSDYFAVIRQLQTECEEYLNKYMS